MHKSIEAVAAFTLKNAIAPDDASKMNVRTVCRFVRLNIKKHANLSALCHIFVNRIFHYMHEHFSTHLERWALQAMWYIQVSPSFPLNRSLSFTRCSNMFFAHRFSIMYFLNPFESRFVFSFPCHFHSYVVPCIFFPFVSWVFLFNQYVILAFGFLCIRIFQLNQCGTYPLSIPFWRL